MKPTRKLITYFVRYTAVIHSYSVIDPKTNIYVVFLFVHVQYVEDRCPSIM